MLIIYLSHLNENSESNFANLQFTVTTKLSLFSRYIIFINKQRSKSTVKWNEVALNKLPTSSGTASVPTRRDYIWVKLQLEHLNE